MQTSLPNSSRTLRHSLIDLLWQQWATLGVSGHVSPAGQTVIDPEALLLLSTVFARHDVRLFDEIADWLERNGNWINLLRLARLQKELHLGDSTVLGALAESLSRNTSHAKWKVLAKRRPHVSELSLLFPHLPKPRLLDPIFERWGWRRAPLETRRLSKAPRPDNAGAFILKLRALFGLQSRAEIIAWLLAHDSGHPAQIARETGYFRGSVQSVLNELEVSGLVVSTRQGREKRFSAPRSHWQFLATEAKGTATEFPRWLPWATFFSLAQHFENLVTSPQFEGFSTQLQSIELQRLLGPGFERLAQEGYALETPSNYRSQLSATEVHSWFESQLARLATSSSHGAASQAPLKL